MTKLVILTALSMAFGWRIRGQFGHEAGAAIAGALGAMAIALLSGRPDWHRRVHFFGLLGALGWSFGGSISYMKVIGYTHSSDSATVLYGFAGVFLIGFLWAGLGGAGTALAAVLDEERLRDTVRATAVIYGAWFLEDVVADILRGSGAGPGNWFDSDWLGATTAAVAALALALARRRLDFGASLVLHLAAGWWIAFGVLVPILGLHLNPPRGDNWAGVIGLFAGWTVFAERHRLDGAARTALYCGILGAVGFCLGQTLKLAWIATGYKWGWHATMEWFHGLFHGVALAVAMLPLVRGAAVSWTALPRMEVFAAVFVAWVIPYLNVRRTPPIWLRHVKSLPAEVYGLNVASNFLPSRGWIGWMELGFLAVGAILVALLVRHARQSLALLSGSWQSRGQLLFLTLLWAMFVISTVHETAMLEPIVIVMQIGVGVTGALCMWLLLTSPSVDVASVVSWPRRMLAIGLAAAILSPLAGWSVKRALYGDVFGGYFYMDHIRFGPNNTNDKR